MSNFSTQQKTCTRCGSDNAYADYEVVSTILGTMKIWVDRCEQEGKQITRSIYISPDPEIITKISLGGSKNWVMN